MGIVVVGGIGCGPGSAAVEDDDNGSFAHKGVRVPGGWPGVWEAESRLLHQLMRVHIFGASGSGTTTLGRALAGQLGIPFFDADDYYWAPAEMPFTVKRSIPERHALLLPDLKGHESWVLSGSMVSWAAPVLPLLQAAIYVYCPSEERISRLWARERERYGSRIEPGGDRHQATLDFIEWAQGYDSGVFEGRSRVRHESFMSSLTIPVLRLSSLDSKESMLSQAVDWLEAMK